MLLSPERFNDLSGVVILQIALSGVILPLLVDQEPHGGEIKGLANACCGLWGVRLCLRRSGVIKSANVKE